MAGCLDPAGGPASVPLTRLAHTERMSDTYDALLLVSFGGPGGPDDVLPFLRNVTRGRNVPEGRLLKVAEHYQRFGGVSPINAANRELSEAIQAELGGHGLDLPVYWGNRNWHPFLSDTMATMTDAGVRRCLAFVTSAYSSYSACRQYQDDIAAARAAVGPGAPAVDKLRHYFNHPGFVGPSTDAVRAALARLPPERRGSTHLAFTAHSIPTDMARRSGPVGGLYVRQLRAAAALVAAAAAPDLPWDLVWQSRSGPPGVSWLEPDINDHLRGLAARGGTGVVVSPIGFISDHIEVLWDLDTEAAATAAGLGLDFARAATAGADRRFVAMVRELVEERIGPDRPRRSLGTLGPSHDRCPAGCCPAPLRRATAAPSPGAPQVS
jgi:ferrochelatase